MKYGLRILSSTLSLTKTVLAEFKFRLKAVVQCSEGDELLRRFETHLFQTHNCSNECDKNCPAKDKVSMPRLPIFLKIVHLFYKEPSLYLGLEDFLALFLRCLVKTHAEGCAESMGNLVDMHCDKRRGRMELEDTGKEAAIHWNCPRLAKAEGLGTRSLDRLFGQGKWNFLTTFNQSHQKTQECRNQACLLLSSKTCYYDNKVPR